MAKQTRRHQERMFSLALYVAALEHMDPTWLEQAHKDHNLSSYNDPYQARALLAEQGEARFNMAYWVAEIHPPAGEHPPGDTPRCGTSGCLAGHCVALFWEDEDEHIPQDSTGFEFDILVRASTLLGLSYDRGRRLFLPLGGRDQQPHLGVPPLGGAVMDRRLFTRLADTLAAARDEDYTQHRFWRWGYRAIAAGRIHPCWKHRPKDLKEEL